MSRTPRPAVPTPADNRSRLAAMEKVAAHFGHSRPAAETILRIESVPTVFVDFDRAVGIGGLPVGRVVIVHGPSNKGKTLFVLGLLKSYLLRDHFANLADAERTTDAEWVQRLFGSCFHHPGFVALPVRFYEQFRGDIRDYFTGVSTARAKGDLPEETRALAVLDSLKKLVPEKLWKELQKATAADAEDNRRQGRRRGGAKGGVDGIGGRAGQVKAAFNSAWMDELVPLLHETKGTIVIIGRETVEESEDPYGHDVVKLGGGQAINFDASLRLRVNAFPIYEGEGSDKVYLGERHVVEVRKTKVHSKSEAVPRAVFHSNADGFDPARDLLATALELGVVSVAGSYYNCHDVPGVERLGQGIDKSLTKLRTQLDVALAVEATCRSKMRSASSPL